MAKKKEPSIRLSEKHGVNPMLVQCPLCAGETGEIALLGRLPKDEEAPRYGVIPGSPPCSKCKELMAMGFLLIEVKDNSDKKNPYRTGRQWVVTKEAAERWGMDTSHGASFIEEGVATALGFPKDEENQSPLP